MKIKIATISNELFYGTNVPLLENLHTKFQASRSFRFSAMTTLVRKTLSYSVNADNKDAYLKQDYKLSNIQKKQEKLVKACV